MLIGYAKGVDYQPGMRFQGRQGEHAWNSVLIDRTWYLFDCHWAARRLVGKEETVDNVRYGLDMFYFMCNPTQLIYTHFPYDSDWQLLAQKITLEDFEQFAPVKSAFFKYNLNFGRYRDAVIRLERSGRHAELRLSLHFPESMRDQLFFTFSFSNVDGSDKYGDVPLR